MMKSTTQMLFVMMLMLSTIMVISANNWMTMWMGLEINMMSFMPLMFKNKNNFSSESSMMYFLIQSMSSVMFLMLILINSNINITFSMINETSSTLMMMTMLMKMGAAPFHMWLPEIMEKMNWINCMILMTWQKIAPMTIMSFMMKNNIILLMAIISTTIGAIGGLNQTSVRKIMAYSSISHLGWMMACMKSENELWMSYLMIYSLLVIMMCIMFQSNSIYFMNQMMLNSSTMLEKVTYVTMMLSLGGLPPFIGFLPKWMVIQTLINSEMYLIMFIMMMTTLLTLFYYLRMISTLIMINSIINKWTLNFKSKSKNMQLMFIIINLMLPMMSIISFF